MVGFSRNSTAPIVDAHAERIFTMRAESFLTSSCKRVVRDENVKSDSAMLEDAGREAKLGLLRFAAFSLL